MAIVYHINKHVKLGLQLLSLKPLNLNLNIKKNAMGDIQI